MSIAQLNSSGTQTAVINTEHTLATVAAGGDLILEVDTSNMAAGDVLELRVKGPTLNGGATIVQRYYSYANAQNADDLAKDLRQVSDQSLAFTLKQTAGTGRTYPWKVMSMAENVVQALGNPVTTATNGILDVNAKNWGNTAVVLDANNFPKVDVQDWLGTVVATPATAGIPDINVKNVNNVSTSSVTTINANQGTTQPVNFTGTGASAFVQSDTRDFGGHNVVLDANNVPAVNVFDWNGVAATGTGTPDINVTKWLGTPVPTTNVNGVPIVDTKYFAGQTITCAAGVTVGAFVGNANAAIGVTVAGKVSEVVLTDTLTTYTGNTVQTGDSFARIGVAGVGLTNLGDTRIAHLDADVSSRMATYTQPAGFLATTFPALVASQITLLAVPDAVWDVVLASHLTPGSTGAALNAAGGAGDPWITALPGAYAAGQAGYILGNITVEGAWTLRQMFREMFAESCGTIAVGPSGITAYAVGAPAVATNAGTTAARVVSVDGADGSRATNTLTP